MLSEAEQDRIAQAVAAAEARTSGEIMCVLTEEVSHYREIPLAWAAAAALILPPLAIVAGARLHLPSLSGGWIAAHGEPSGAGLWAGLWAYALAQAAVFALVAALGAVPAVRRRLTPRFLKARRARQAAVRHFTGAAAHLKPGQTAVLIFAALADRQMEIVAHDSIDQAVGQDAWDRIVAEALAAIRAGGTAAGLVKAVELCGAVMAERFPGEGAPNALPDRPLQV
jgi:putative membrane protein